MEPKYFVHFDVKWLERLKAANRYAHETHVAYFRLEDRLFYTKYSDHLIQYLETALRPETDR